MNEEITKVQNTEEKKVDNVGLKGRNGEREGGILRKKKRGRKKSRQREIKEEKEK